MCALGAWPTSSAARPISSEESDRVFKAINGDAGLRQRVLQAIPPVLRAAPGKSVDTTGFNVWDCDGVLVEIPEPTINPRTIFEQGRDTGDVAFLFLLEQLKKLTGSHDRTLAPDKGLIEHIEARWNEFTAPDGPSKIDPREMYAMQAKITKGLPPALIESWLAKLWRKHLAGQIYLPMSYVLRQRLLKRASQADPAAPSDVIISANRGRSLEQLARFIVGEAGPRVRIIANEVTLDVNGRLSDELTARPYGPGKAEALHQLVEESGQRPTRVIVDNPLSGDRGLVHAVLHDYGGHAVFVVSPKQKEKADRIRAHAEKLGSKATVVAFDRSLTLGAVLAKQARAQGAGHRAGRSFANSSREVRAR